MKPNRALGDGALMHITMRATMHALMLAAVAALTVACGGSSPQPPAIIGEPADVSATEGAAAVFSVDAVGDNPLTYAWHDGASGPAIPGATTSTYRIDAASLQDHGKSFRAVVDNALGSATSRVATLSVTERGFAATAPLVGTPLRNTAAVVDSNGHTHVLTINGDTAGTDVQAHLRLAGANTLAPLQTLQAAAALTQPTTSIRAAANGAGHVLAVWHRNGIVGGALYSPGATATTAGTWQLLPTRINSFGATSALDPAVAAAGNTGFEIVWREQATSTDPHDIRARRYTIAGDQLANTIDTIEASGDETRPPHLVADAAGNLLAAWSYDQGGCVFNRRAAGTAWGTSTTVAEGASGYHCEVLKGNAAGRALLLVSNRLGAGTFAVLELAQTSPISIIGGYNAYGSAPDAHVFADGRMRIFGVSVDTDAGNVSRLFAWFSNASGAWGAAQPVSAISSNDFIASGNGVLNPQVAGADAAGNLMVVWEERDGANGGRGRLMARRYHAGLDAWRDITPFAADASPTADRRQPVAALAPDGSGLAVYRDAALDTSGWAMFR